MTFAKQQKNKAYFMRYQTKYRRRRQGLTDYYARKRLITQDKNKFNSPKYRLVGRISSTKITAQIIYSTLEGDKVFCSADSRDLKNYGLTAAFNNYPAGYATGYLLAKRLLKKTKMDQFYTGVQNVDGDYYDVSKNPHYDRKPFKCILDVGLRSTTHGNRIFSILKGACDGGLYVPHKTKKFPGYKGKGQNQDQNVNKFNQQYNAELHRQRIFGVHIDKYMQKIKGNHQKFKLQFALVNKCLETNKVKTVQELYKKIHDGIREDPLKGKQKKDQNKEFNHSHKKFYPKKLKLQQRKQRVQKKIQKQFKKFSKKDKKDKKKQKK